MVFYFHPRGYVDDGKDDYLIYMGRDKYEVCCVVRSQRAGGVCGGSKMAGATHTKHTSPPLLLQFSLSPLSRQNEDLIKYGLPTDVW